MVVYREIGRETVVYREIGRETWSKQDEESLVTRVKEIWSNRQKEREREREINQQMDRHRKREGD